MWRPILAVAVLLAGTAWAVVQSQAPVVGALVEGATVVAGQAAQGSAPIAIYDISFAEKTKIGMAGTVASDGSFSSPVRPALIKGHQIVAIDKDGNASVPVTVAAAPQP
jgi:hypothetical protein